MSEVIFCKTSCAVNHYLVSRNTLTRPLFLVVLCSFVFSCNFCSNVFAKVILAYVELFILRNVCFTVSHVFVDVAFRSWVFHRN